MIEVCLLEVRTVKRVEVTLDGEIRGPKLAGLCGWYRRWLAVIYPLWHLVASS